MLIPYTALRNDTNEAVMNRNEDNWGVIKNIKENNYKLAPIYDCGNCFYSRTDDDRISLIMSDESRMIDSSINCITAYEDDEGNNIHFLDLLNSNNQDLMNSIDKILDILKYKKEEIYNFINSIDNAYKDISITSDIRKKYYLKTFEYRVDRLKNYQGD